jgi:uncharacterized protein with FMN-binding domain/polyferredoxin
MAQTTDPKKNKMITTVTRRMVQAVCFIFVPSLFIQIFNSMKSIVMLAFHGQGTISGIMPDIILLASATVVTAVAGRFFCGWMCAFGSTEDFIYRFPRFLAHKKNSPKYISRGSDTLLKAVKYIILAVFAVFVWGLQIMSYPDAADPWALFGRMVSLIKGNAFGTLAEGWMIAAGLLALIFIGSFFIERFFCRYLCPVGAYFSIISRLRPFSIRKTRKNCGNCRLCTSKCSMGINLNDMDRVSSGECINCMECVRYCPSGNAALDLDENKKNAIAVGAVSCSLIVGGYYLGNIYENNSQASAVTSGTQTTTETTMTAAGAYADLADGTYTGSGNGFSGTTTVAVSVKNGYITDVTITSAADEKEYLDRASSTVISEILRTQSPDVDAVSGATYSSNGIISAVRAALSGSSYGAGTAEESTESDVSTAAGTADESTAASDNTEDSTQTETQTGTAASGTSISDIADGTYTGTGTGLRGQTQVSVTVKDGKITDIAIDSYQDDQQFFEKAESTIIDEIISDQSVDVDAVSGATYSSNGIREAVADALGQTFTPSTIQNEGHGGMGGRH